MNKRSASLMKFVLYSVHELLTRNGAGFWSNEEGWVVFQSATRFTVSTLQTCNIPSSMQAGAEWIGWEDTPGHDRCSVATISITASRHNERT